MKKFILPVTLIMTATGGAFATNLEKDTEENLAPRQGYIYNHAIGTCEESVMCSTTPGDICTVTGEEDGQRVFDLNPGELNTCTTVLYKP